MDNFYYQSHESPVKRKVLGDINNTADSPISPTANLKLLTKVASQCDSIENINSTPPLNKNSKNLNVNPQVKGNLRKFKSLGFLCDKFLRLYPLDIPEYMESQILLSDLARQLGVEKRRIYDIINVVESLQMATKIGKNSYTWTGHKKLADTLSQLKACAEQLGLTHYVRREQCKRKLYLNLHKDDVECTDASNAFSQNSNIASFFRNERRIGILCQKFVMLFLVSLKDGLINLELATEVLVGVNCHQNKTRMRRLYDIANILVSLGIISKLEVGSGWKKPIFQYVGPPLHEMSISYESSLLSNLVKTELSDNVRSDISEDSTEVSWEPEETFMTSVTESDHSYSMDSTLSSSLEPAAKKRLLFTADSAHKAVLSENEPLTINPAQVTVAAPQTRLVRLVGPVGVSQHITSGGLYKAIKIGSSLHFIRIDKS